MTYSIYEKRWPSDKANHICYKLLYVIQLVENSFGKVTSADIRVFGRTCLFAMLLLIGFALFYTPGVFV